PAHTDIADTMSTTPPTAPRWTPDDPAPDTMRLPLAVVAGVLLYYGLPMGASSGSTGHAGGAMVIVAALLVRALMGPVCWWILFLPIISPIRMVLKWRASLD